MPGCTYILIVSIEDYNNPKHFRKVRYANKDADELKKAFLSCGVDKDDITMLLNANATQTAIKEEVAKISRKALEQDRIIFYFSGHGAFESGENYLLPVDCYNDNIKNTSVSINYILGKLKSSLSKKNILFLDCCHSGFEPGDDTKSIDRAFLSDELIYNTREEEYTIGFASCKSSQTSITHPALQHSVWTYFLIMALKGDGGKIYQHGLLFSDKLQSYLKKETKEFVKLNTDDKKDQVPIMFGNLTDNFLVADLTSIFDERERSRKIDDISFTNITILNEDSGRVKDLPGFQKGIHTIPTSKSATTDNFVKRIGNQLIKEPISELGIEIRSELRYKLKQIQIDTGDGLGAINTPDFTYSMEIKHSVLDPTKYLLVTRLFNFRSSEIIFKPEFNRIFAHQFHKLEFLLSKEIDIEKFITNFEEVEDMKNIEIDYDPSDLSCCKISMHGLKHEIILYTDSLSIETANTTDPQNLINAYRETHKLILANPNLNLLD